MHIIKGSIYATTRALIIITVIISMIAILLFKRLPYVIIRFRCHVQADFDKSIYHS